MRLDEHARVELNRTGPASGKVNKQALIRAILAEEQAKGRDVSDRKRIALIANKRQETVPPDKRSEVKANDVKEAQLQHKYGRPAGDKTAPPAPRKIPAAPPESFTLEDLKAAKDFLDRCGGSLVRAQQLLNGIIALTSA